MRKPFFDLERIDPEALRAAGAALRKAGYTEKGVAERLSLEDVAAVELARYPYYQQRSLRQKAPLDVAISLFLLQGVVTAEELAELLDKPARKALRVAGVLAGDRASHTFRARVSLYPVGEERLFATDHRFTQHDPWLRARVPRDPVMYLGADSYYLARSTLRSPTSKAVLDLCSGSGVHALLAAGSAERAVGVDLNPRALNFARLNAILNDAWNTVFLEGDLWKPVEGERFDLVLANPPFVPSPVYELSYRDGGPSGADVLRRVIAALPDHLGPGGVAQVVTHIAEREGERYLDRVRRWIGGANMHLHALRLGEEDIVGYAMAQVRRTFGEHYGRYATRLNEWVTNLRSQRFRRVVAVILTFLWNDEAPHPPWTQEDEAKPPQRPLAKELGRLLAAKRRARLFGSLSALDGMRVGVPDDLVLTERRRPTGKGFETRELRVALREATISPELDVKPLVRDLLERIDNRATVPELIARLAAETGQPAAQLDERCRRALLVMLERGIVTLDAVADAPAPAAVAVAPEAARAEARPSTQTPPDSSDELQRPQTRIDRPSGHDSQAD